MNLRFPGQYWDQETQTHYNFNRDYTPNVGRYLQSDPIGLEGGVNLFGYVEGNPLGAVDSKGLQVALPSPTATAGLLVAGAIIICASNSDCAQHLTDGLNKVINAVKDACPCLNYADVYEPNSGKHGNRTRQGPRGPISPEPSNGAAVLASAVSAGASKIGYDPTHGEIVIFRNHSVDEKNCIKYWHGYVVNVNDLDAEQWRAGKKSGFPKWPRKPK